MQNQNNTRIVLLDAIDNAMQTEEPSRRQAKILQLLGDAEVDRDGLINKLRAEQEEKESINSIALVSISDEPTSYKKAISGINSHQWKDAIQKEYDSHILNNTWTLVECPDGAKIIGNM